MYLEHRSSLHISEESKKGGKEQKELIEDSKIETRKKRHLRCGIPECGFLTGNKWTLDVHVRAQHSKSDNQQSISREINVPLKIHW